MRRSTDIMHGILILRLVILTGSIASRARWSSSHIVLRGIFLRQPEICRGKPLSCDLMMMQPDEYGIGDQDTGIIQQMGNHTEGHETLVKASMEYPQMYPDKTYDHHFDDYDAFTTLRLDSYTGFSSGCCSASALGELLRRRQRLLLYPP